MKQRWLVVIVGLPALLAVLLLCPAWATLLLVCGIAGVAAYELLHTAGKNVPKKVYVVTIGIAAFSEWVVYDWRKWYYAADLIAYGDAAHAPFCRWFILPLVLVIFLFWVAIVTYGSEKPFTFCDVSVSIVGGIVFPMMYSCIFLLRMHESFGKVYVLAPFFIAFAGDALSMYFGMWFGKRKMAPHVSPNKTWAGGIGGPIGSALAMCLLGLIGAKCFGYAPDYLHLIGVGAVANVFGQLGDLSMSLIKRENGVKDYSHLFLTHGGMLDRFDSSMFIAPVVYLCVSGGII